MQLPLDKIIEWDILNWSQLITYWAPVIDTLPKDAKILAIGERSGGLSTWLAILGFNVVCSDREFPELAFKNHKSMSLASRVTYRAIDIVHFEELHNQFDLVIAKSVIGGLKADPSNRLTRNFEVQQKAVNNIYRLLKDGGYFLSAENMQGAIIMSKARTMLNKDKGWRYLHYDELRSLFSKFEIKQLNTFGVLPTSFSNRHLNNMCFALNKYILNFLPKKYKYISFLVVQKSYK